ncbi:CHASE3 domain-containing protein [Kitasatospora sp. NPDC059571]|uniref:sensor histidine kinase n=1 Tax=Kitasatospora sp. NPDC059571 TaxID=3346871 RepID=UPI0036C0DE60
MADSPAGTAASPTAPQDRPGRADRTPWTTRRWLRVGVAAALVVLTSLCALGGAVFVHAGAVADRLVDRTSPALNAAGRLETALVDQESGVRGYGLTGRPEFLEPYTRGLALQQQTEAELRGVLAGDDRATADLTVLTAAAASWQRLAARPVVSAPPGAPVAEAGLNANDAKRSFDAIRTASTRFQDGLRRARAADRAALSTVRAQRNTVFGCIAAVIAALAVLVFEALRRGVTGPLARLGADADAVAGGAFDRRIRQTGPADLRSLAASMEAMRHRLVDEVADADAARALLAAQTADLQRSNAELEQFAYVASHDLQEPLRKVASFCQLLERRYAADLDDRARQYIAFAVDGANRMQTLINDLLDFSRVGRLHRSHDRVDLQELLRTTEEALGVQIEEAGAVVTHGPLPVVEGDRTQLGILLQNLVSNAVKFRSPERPPLVHLSAERSEDGWTLAVSDNGIGIAPEFEEKVFVIFQRLHTRDAYPGNGIGLAMCKKIVEFHGGTIRIDGAHAPGTRLVFTLPAAEQPDDGEALPGLPAQAAPDDAPAAADAAGPGLPEARR